MALEQYLKLKNWIFQFLFLWLQPEAYLGPYQTSMMELFAKIVNGFKSL